MRFIKDVGKLEDQSFWINALMVAREKEFWEKLESECNSNAVKFVMESVMRVLQRKCKHVTIRDGIIALRRIELMLISEWLKSENMASKSFKR